MAYDQEQAAITACSTERNPPVDCVQQAKNAYAAVINQLQTAQRNLASATLTAPHAGVVNTINGTVGSAPSASSSSSSGAFIQVVDPSSLTLSASVNEADIGNIAVGQQATFTVTAYKSVVFHATVASISQVGASTSSVVTYPVTFTVDMTRLQGAHLLSGMTAIDDHAGATSQCAAGSGKRRDVWPGGGEHNLRRFPHAHAGQRRRVHRRSSC